MLEQAKNPQSPRVFDVPELFKLLRTWSSIKEKKFVWTDLICCERTEIIEAIESGE